MTWGFLALLKLFEGVIYNNYDFKKKKAREWQWRWDIIDNQQ